MRIKKYKNKIIFATALLLGFIVVFGIYSIFAATPINITFKIGTSGAGTVKGNQVNCPGDCAATFTLDSKVKSAYVATETSSYIFSGWDTNGDGAVEYTSKTLNVTHNKTWVITAVYKPAVKIIFIQPAKAGFGNIEGDQISCGYTLINLQSPYTQCSAKYLKNTPFTTYTLKYISGTKFIGWDVNNDGKPEYTNTTINVNHEKNWQITPLYSTLASAPPPTCQINASPNYLFVGEHTFLYWKTTNAISALLDGAQVGLIGDKVIFPEKNTSYTLQAYNLNNGTLQSAECSVVVTVYEMY